MVSMKSLVEGFQVISSAGKSRNPFVHDGSLIVVGLELMNGRSGEKLMTFKMDAFMSSGKVCWTTPPDATRHDCSGSHLCEASKMHAPLRA